MEYESLRFVDPDIYEAIRAEIQREEEKIVLIASENYVSRAVLEAQGSIFTNKYAEGYPGRRYYGGCEFADRVEELAIERAKELLRLSMSMFSLILEHRQIWQYFLVS